MDELGVSLEHKETLYKVTTFYGIRLDHGNIFIVVLGIIKARLALHSSLVALQLFIRHDPVAIAAFELQLSKKLG
jgi:hypothetical protein